MPGYLAQVPLPTTFWEPIEMMREVGFPIGFDNLVHQRYVNLQIEAENEYELALIVTELENRLNATFVEQIHIEKPILFRDPAAEPRRTTRAKKAT